MDAEKFGKFIASRRKELMLTQKDLANKLQVTDKAISRWERGIGFPDINILLFLTFALFFIIFGFVFFAFSTNGLW